MSERLEARVRESGISLNVETRDRLAVLIPGSGADAIQLGAEARRRLLEMARAEGFTHVAIELDPDVAAFPGD